MIATITFDLSDQEDASLFKLMNKAEDLQTMLWDFDQYLRSEVKYSESPDDTETVRERLWELLNEYQINIYD